MSHSHDHHDVVADFAHAERHLHVYRNYRYLFAIGFIGAIAEFLIALVLAHSVSVQADAIHALTHLSLYALACVVSGQIVARNMNPHEAYHYQEKFIYLYALLIFVGLAWILFTSITKLQSSENVITTYMFMSAGIGLSANIIALKILNAISKAHVEVVHKHRTHQLLNKDTRGDLAFSVIVLITSITSLSYPWLPIRIIDPVISFGAIGWIGWSIIRIIINKK